MGGDGDTMSLRGGDTGPGSASHSVLLDALSELGEKNPLSTAGNSPLNPLLGHEWKKGSKNFRKRFLEFSPWFYYLHNFQWPYC